MEKASLSDAGLKEGISLVLEDGVAPKAGQITITFAAAAPVQDTEIILDKVGGNKGINGERNVSCLIKEMEIILEKVSGNN